MKFHSTILAVAILIGTQLSQSCYAAITITDDFNDGVFDTSKWNATLPFAESSFSESGGKLTLNNRAIISTNAELATATFSGQMMSSRYDIVRFATRTSLTPLDLYFNEIDGVHFSWHFDSNTIAIEEASGATLALASYAFNAGQYYDFVISDDGINLAWSINGVQQLTATSSYSSGSDFLAIYNREVNRGWGIPSTSSFDSLTIVGTPEPTRAMLLLAGLLTIVCRRSRHFATHSPKNRSPLP